MRFTFFLYTMAAIGSLVFCTDCGNLLESSQGKPETLLLCEVCGASNKDTSSKTLVTKSKPSAFPSTLRQRLTSKTQAVSDSERDASKDAIASETCEACGGKEVRFSTAQLRSADEGTTVFYNCGTCGHKWVENN